MAIQGNKKAKRILHTSDLHIISPGDIACQSLDRLVNLSNQAGMDLVIIAGDLFDSNVVDEELLLSVIEQFKAIKAPTVILPGNHDCLMPGSVFDKDAIWSSILNIHIFKAIAGETFFFNDLGISVWGKPNSSFTSQSRPMTGIPEFQENGYWHIGVAHGYYAGTDLHLPYSYQIAEDEIASSNHDYIALGHSVAFRDVCLEPVKAYYSGSPSESNIVALVDLSKDGVEVTPFNLSI